ncbi:MAG TPA: hypothetical protein V6C72_14960, partial [Chroococcales cyanobacterium]
MKNQLVNLVKKFRCAASGRSSVDCWQFLKLAAAEKQKSAIMRRAIAILMMALVLTCAGPMPAVLAQAAQLQPPAGGKPVIDNRQVKAKLGPHRLKPVSYHLTFSKNPTDLEIASARVFSEPLVAMTTAPVPGENAALSAALLAYKTKAASEDTS